MVTCDSRQIERNEISVLSLLPFISNKRQVKRGNCHTLISSGEHCLMACNLCLTTSRYLAPFVAQYVKFRDMPDVSLWDFSFLIELTNN